MALAAWAGEQLIRTAGGGKLHIRGCSHFSATSELLVATDQDAASLELCTACAAELNGQGRTAFDTVDDAMEAFNMPVEARSRVRELVAHVGADRVWIPYSRSYIALGRDGTRALYIGKTYVWIDGELTTLPGYAPGGGGGTATAERAIPVCHTCGLELPRTGICDNC
jgi:hypothetical protein